MQRAINQLFNWFQQSLGKKDNNPKIPDLLIENRAFNIVNPIPEIKNFNSLLPEEKIVFLLSLVPHIKPHFFDPLLPKTGNHPQIGGSRGKHHRGFLPTGETAIFLLAGDDLRKRAEVQKIFSRSHFFYKERILWLEKVPAEEPWMSGRIVMNPEYVQLFTTGEVSHPEFSMEFPAEVIETELEWRDLVLHRETSEQIQELDIWLHHHTTLMKDWGMQHRLKPGYRALFHGPPGTGKTLTAGLLGKTHKIPVFRVDLSMVVSKYIGETEKNLSNLFARAEGKKWILFFDEADALFGRRTSVGDAHDKYANQEVAYLLQRVEGYNGLVILASNFKSNIDEAFMRRFQSVIHFPLPGPSERLLLWGQAFPEKVKLSSEIDLKQLAKQYELSGADIMSIVQYCCLCALGRESNIIQLGDIQKGIRREYRKGGELGR